VRVVDKSSGTVTADHSYFWCGSLRCLAHDNTQSGSPVSTQYFDQGVITGGTSYYYVRDQLGSVRQLISSGGSVAVAYDYDSYGNPTTLSGSAVSDIGYGGYFHHAVSGLDFTLYRAYDAAHARWLNRDPIGEGGGPNLYAYVNGNPLTDTDPLGLIDVKGLIRPILIAIIQLIANDEQDPPPPPPPPVQMSSVTPKREPASGPGPDPAPGPDPGPQQSVVPGAATGLAAIAAVAAAAAAALACGL
jgi:RHS repeat-associated protein